MVELQANWATYQLAVEELKKQEDIMDLYVKTFLKPRLPLGPNLAIISIQMHIFGINAASAESDFTQLQSFHSTLNETEFQEVFESQASELLTSYEAAVIFVNCYVDLWNKQLQQVH